MPGGSETTLESNLSILEYLYELWINQDPACDEHVRQLYGMLELWMGGMSTAEAEELNHVIVDLCVAYARKGFLDGARLGGQLIQEILLSK